MVGGGQRPLVAGEWPLAKKKPTTSNNSLPGKKLPPPQKVSKHYGSLSLKQHITLSQNGNRKHKSKEMGHITIAELQANSSLSPGRCVGNFFLSSKRYLFSGECICKPQLNLRFFLETNYSPVTFEWSTALFKWPLMVPPSLHLFIS